MYCHSVGTVQICFTFLHLCVDFSTPVMNCLLFETYSVLHANDSLEYVKKKELYVYCLVFI